jgi:hypothetical protein
MQNSAHFGGGVLEQFRIGPLGKRLHLKGTMTGTGYTSFTTFFSFYLPTSTLPYHPTTHKPPNPSYT